MKTTIISKGNTPPRSNLLPLNSETADHHNGSAPARSTKERMTTRERKDRAGSCKYIDDDEDEMPYPGSKARGPAEFERIAQRRISHDQVSSSIINGEWKAGKSSLML